MPYYLVQLFFIPVNPLPKATTRGHQLLQYRRYRCAHSWYKNDTGTNAGGYL